MGLNFHNLITPPVNHLLAGATTISNKGCNLSCYRNKFGWSFKIALCDYFELVTTVIGTTIWVTYWLQTVVTFSELLFIDW